MSDTTLCQRGIIGDVKTYMYVGFYIPHVRIVIMETWSVINNWHLVIPPSRPSLPQLDLTSQILSLLDRTEKVAVLGSTPEFRDLLYELGFGDVYIFEKNEKAHHMMTSLRIYQSAENLVVGDWLDSLEVYANHFSVVLSDLTMGNIKYEDRERFYKLVEGALVRRGFFIDKVLTHPIPHMPLESLAEKYSRAPLNLLHVNHFSCEMLFCSELLEIEEVVNTSLFYRILGERLQNERLRSFSHAAKRITPEHCVWYYGRHWEELSKTYCTGLKLITVDDDEIGSPYYGRLKHFILQKE